MEAQSQVCLFIKARSSEHSLQGSSISPFRGQCPWDLCTLPLLFTVPWLHHLNSTTPRTKLPAPDSWRDTQQCHTQVALSILKAFRFQKREKSRQIPFPDQPQGQQPATLGSAQSSALTRRSLLKLQKSLIRLFLLKGNLTEDVCVGSIGSAP